MNETSENFESGSESGSEGSQAQTVETVEVDYSEQLTAIYELQYWTFGLIAVFVGLFISYLILNIIKRYF